MFKDPSAEVYDTVKNEDGTEKEGSGKMEYITKKSLMAVAQELGEDLTEEEIEELIIGASKKSDILKLGVVKSEDTSKTDKTSTENAKKVSKEEFKKFLGAGTGDRHTKQLNSDGQSKKNWK